MVENTKAFPCRKAFSLKILVVVIILSWYRKDRVTTYLYGDTSFFTKC